MNLQEVNDPAGNDREEKVPLEIVQHLKELGAFGLQVRTMVYISCG